jgi:glycine/D-amino acid oxidase-like deaminating enzyme
MPPACAEVQSERFHGGLLYKRSGQMHMGRFAYGLATAAERHGAAIHTGTEVRRLERIGNTHAHRVHTARGTITAKQVLLATGASRHGAYGSFGWLRRRIVPIGSFIVVTEPLGAERAATMLAKQRTYTTVANIHHYFRMTPDTRLVFGGRARFAISSPQSDAASGDPAPGPARDLPAAGPGAPGLLLGRPGRHDPRPPAAGRPTRRAVLLHGL